MKTFKIKKGKQRSGFHFGFTFKKIITFEASFDEGCLYEFPVGDKDREDINKLFGISTTWFHHRQSARIGWRCLDNKNIELLTYSYNDGVRKNEEHDILGTVKPNQKFKCQIEDLEQKYLFKFMKEGDYSYVTAFDLKKPDWFIFHYFLWPHFGGDKMAPQDMKIKIERLSSKDYRPY